MSLDLRAHDLCPRNTSVKSNEPEPKWSRIFAYGNSYIQKNKSNKLYVIS